VFAIIQINKTTTTTTKSRDEEFLTSTNTQRRSFPNAIIKFIIFLPKLPAKLPLPILFAAKTPRNAQEKKELPRDEIEEEKREKQKKKKGRADFFQPLNVTGSQQPKHPTHPC